MYEIKKGIEMPTKRRGKIIFPWEDLEVGDCFDIPTEGIRRRRPAVFASLHIFNKINGKNYKITTQKVDDFIRVWRIE